MRQLITRIDDELHERLKARAAAEGRSVNSLVLEVLAAAVDHDPRAAVRNRLARSGQLAVPRILVRPGRDAVLTATRGTGRAVSEALAAERAGR